MRRRRRVAGVGDARRQGRCGTGVTAAAERRRATPARKPKQQQGTKRRAVVARSLWCGRVGVGIDLSASARGLVGWVYGLIRVQSLG